MTNLLNRLLHLEEINGANRCPTYLYRWRLASTRWFKVYIHHFVGDDWSLDLHDHPKRFISVGLWGGYIEHTPSGAREYRAPWFRSFAAEHIHRITLGRFLTCWTLVVVFAASRPWGFWHDGVWINWKDYVYGSSSSIADQMKACQD